MSQPTLFDVLEMLEQKRFDVVRTKRIGKAIELVLRLTLSA